MTGSPRAIAYGELQAALSGFRPPLVIDVRRQPQFLAASAVLAGSVRRDPDGVATWSDRLHRAASVVVYCAHGGEVSQHVAVELEQRGLDARFLEGGIESWREHDGALSAKPSGAPTCWVTRARPKIDRVACPWLIARFIDPQAEFVFVPAERVLAVASERRATPFDVPETPLSHHGPRCSFDAFLDAFHLHDRALDELATIVRAADTGALDLAPQAYGLFAISLGLSRVFADDHEMLGHALVLYDALHAWCKDGKDEAHTWNPAAQAR